MAATKPTAGSTHWDVALNAAIDSLNATDAALTARLVAVEASLGLTGGVNYSVAPMPVISRNVPAWAIGADVSPSNANDSNYSTIWRSVDTPTPAAPQWLAYDVSSVTVERKTSCVLVWHNDSSGDYDNANPVASQPRDYTIEGNAAPGVVAPPTTGWVNLATVVGNIFHCREHLLNLSAYNWVRIVFTSSNGAPGNTDIAIQMDIHDASAGRFDDWLFLGDSITVEGMTHRSLVGTSLNGGPLAQLISAVKTERFPLMLNGGHSGINALWANQNKATLLEPFGGHYVTLNYGTNDANQGAAVTESQIAAFYVNMLSVTDYVLSLGKVPVIPTIPWGPANSGFLGSNAAILNDQIRAIYAARPAVVQGPDMWTFFHDHPNLLRDGIHPHYTTDDVTFMYGGFSGYENWQRQWRDALIANLYDRPAS